MIKFKDMKIGNTYECDALLISAKECLARNATVYLDMRLSDGERQEQCKLFDTTLSDLYLTAKPGETISCSIMVSMYRDNQTFTIKSIRHSNLEPKDFVIHPPYEADDMIRMILKKCSDDVRTVYEKYRKWMSKAWIIPEMYPGSFLYDTMRFVYAAGFVKSYRKNMTIRLKEIQDGKTDPIAIVKLQKTLGENLAKCFKADPKKTGKAIEMVYTTPFDQLIREDAKDPKHRDISLMHAVMAGHKFVSPMTPEAELVKFITTQNFDMNVVTAEHLEDTAALCNIGVLAAYDYSLITCDWTEKGQLFGIKPLSAMMIQSCDYDSRNLNQVIQIIGNTWGISGNAEKDSPALKTLDQLTRKMLQYETAYNSMQEGTFTRKYPIMFKEVSAAAKAEEENS